MKLSTFCRIMKASYLNAEYIEKRYPTPDWPLFVKFYESVWLCNHANNVSYRLQTRTQNRKLIEEYAELTILVHTFIKSVIGPYETADAYIRDKYDMYGPVDSLALEFRKTILNDMIEWAESQEQSHQQ